MIDKLHVILPLTSFNWNTYITPTVKDVGHYHFTVHIFGEGGKARHEKEEKKGIGF